MRQVCLKFENETLILCLASKRSSLRFFNKEGGSVDEPLLGDSKGLFFDNFDSKTGAILKSGKSVNFDGIPLSVFDNEQTYFICVDCGKVYWEGGHFRKAMTSFEVTSLDEGDEKGEIETEGGSELVVFG